MTTLLFRKENLKYLKKLPTSVQCARIEFEKTTKRKTGAKSININFI